MSGDIVLGIRLKYDGKEVDGGVVVSREHFRQLAADAKKAGEATAGGFTSAAKGVRSVSEQLEQAQRAVLGYLTATRAADVARWITEQSSAMLQLEARLKVATANAQDYARASAGVFEIANRWGAAVDQTAGAFARLNPVVAQMGGDAGITLRMIDGLAASLRLSGATAGETNAVLLQFAQAMGSGRVGGDEFRSMMESAEPLMRAVAQQLGKTTGELRQMAEEGRLTSSVFGNALLPAIDKLRSQAEQIPLGISQAWQVLENNLKRDFGREFSEQSSAVGASIKAMSEQSAEAAAAVHALADGVVEVGKAGAVVAAGAGAAWMAKQGQAAYETATAFMATRSARIADAQAAEVQATTDVKRAQTTLALMVSERERALLTLAASNATIHATTSIGAESAALRYGADAAARKSAALLMLADASKVQSIATRDLAAAEAALAAAQARTAEATALGTGAAKLASGTVTALGGGLGIVLTALTAGATAWALWGDSAKKAGEDAEAGVEQALKALENQAAVAATGNTYAPVIAAERAALAQLREQRSQYWQENNTELAKVQRDLGRMDAEIARREQKLSRLETESAKGADSGPGRLSAGGEWGKLTESLKWREKLITKYGEDAVNLTNAYAGRLAKAIADGAPTDKIVAEYNAASRAMAEEHQRALESMPDAKEAKAIADATAEARIHAAEAASKRVLEVLKQEHEQFRMSTEQFIRSSAEVKVKTIGAQLAAVAEKLRAATKESERIPLREKIQELTAQLAAIPGQATAAFEDAAAKTRDLLAEMAVDAGKALAPLEQAGAAFAKKYSEKIQQAVADGNQGVIDAAAQVWANVANQAQFDTAKARYSELMVQLSAELDAVRADAERDGGVLAALGAEQQAEQIRHKFIPALREARGEMERMRGESPINGKAVADAGREIKRVAEEISPFWRDFIRDMHTGVTSDLMRRVGTDGQSYGKAFIGSLQSYFKTAALKLPVQLIGDLVVGGAKSFFGGNGPGGGSLLNLASNGASLFNAGSNLAGMFGAGSIGYMGGGMASMASGVTLTSGAAAGFYPGAIGASIGGQGVGSVAASAAAAGAEAGALSSVAAAAPYVAAALVAAHALGVFDGDGDAERTGNWSGGLGQRGGSTNNRWFSGSEMGASLDAFSKATAASEQAIIKNLMLSSAQVAKIDAELAKLANKSYGFGMEHTDWMASAADEQIVADRFKAIADALGMTVEQLAGEITVSTESLRAAYDNVVMSDSEKLAAKTEAVRKAFVDLGQAMPASIAEYRAAVKAAETGGDATKPLYRQLMALAPAFAEVANAAEQAASGTEAAAAVIRSADDIAAERASLQQDLNQLTMTEAELLGLRRASIAASNQELFDDLNSLKAARAAADTQASLIEQFASEGEKLVNAQAMLAAGFAALNHAVPTTAAEFFSLAGGADVTTTAGQALLAQLAKLAPAFGVVSSAAEQAAAQAAELKRQRETYYAELGEAVRAHQAEDARKTAAATDAYTRAMLEASGDQAGLQAFDRAARRAALLLEGWTEQQIDAVFSVQAAHKTAAATDAYTRAMLEASGDQAGLQAFDRAARRAALLLEGWTEQQIDAVFSVQDRRSATDRSFSALQRSIDAEKTALRDRYDAQIKAQEERQAAAARADQARIERARGSLESVKAVADQIHRAVGSVSVESDALTAARRAEADAVLSRARATAAAGGSLVGFPGLEAALGTLAQPAQQLYASFADYAQAQDRTAAMLADLDSGAAAQVSVAQLQLDALNGLKVGAEASARAQVDALQRARDMELAALDAQLDESRTQLDALRGIDTSVIGVRAAIDGLTAAMLAERTGVSPAAVSAGASVASAGSAAAGSAAAGVGASPAAAGAGTVPAAIASAGDGVARSYLEMRDLAKQAYAAFHGQGSFAAVEAAFGDASQWGQAFFGSPGGFNAEQLRTRYKFASGAAFSNGIVMQPTRFDADLMGEAGAEAIMPLENVNGRLGVAARSDPALLNEVRALRDENQRHAVRIIELTMMIEKLMRRWDGEGLPGPREVDQPIPVTGG